MNVFITGGAGFVGSNLARRFREKEPERRIVAFDNLKRRGSELNLTDFKSRNIEFVHGDIRSADDLNAVEGNFDLFIEAAAEPSVLAGVDSDPSYLLQTNLTGTLNCLEFARKRCRGMIFLSTSRVYSLPALRGMPLAEEETRFSIDAEAITVKGLSAKGIAEDFDISRFRSLYGASKLASELIIQEYCALFDMAALINRCGTIAGPGQWGKVEQGVYTLWVANHYFEKPLRYIGYGCQGKQVRDLLHPHDLFALLEVQAGQLQTRAGEVFNVGGGLEISTSLLEYTRLCEEITGNSVEIGSVVETSQVDIPCYVSDYSKAAAAFAWKPEKTVRNIVEDIYAWLQKEHEQVKAIFN